MSFESYDIRNLFHWFLIFVLVVAFTVIGLAIYPDVNSEDPYGLIRSLVLRSTTMLMGGLWLMLQISALDILIPGDNLKDMSEKPGTIAYIYSAYIIALSIIFAYS